MHSLRLSYLRNVDDPYVPRIVSFDSSYRSNPYIVASGLASEERWPELIQSPSPPPSDDEAGTSERPHRHGGYPGASGLKYTTTIMGPSRVGAAGLRVSGKRASVSRPSFSRRSSRAASEPGIAVEVEHATPEADASSSNINNTANANTAAQGASAKSPAPMVRVVEDMTSDHHTTSGGTSSHDETSAPPPTGKTSPKFVPKFKGAAEMEERRRLRMLARAGPSAALPTGSAASVAAAKSGVRFPDTAMSLNPELSSSDEEEDEDEDEGMPDDDDDDDDDEEYDMVADDSLDMDGDEFDP